MPVYIFVVTFLADVGFILGRMTQVFYAIRLGADTSVVLLIGAAQGVTYAVTAGWVAGPLIARVGTRRLLRWSALLLVPNFLVTPLVDSYWWLLVLSALTGPPMAVFWPSLHTRIVERTEPAAVPHAQSMFNITWSVAVVLSFGSSGWLFQLGWDRGWGPWLAAGVGALVSGLVACVPLPEGRLHSPVTDHADDPFSAAATGIRLSPEGRRVFGVAGWIANFGSFFVFEAVRLVFPSLGHGLGFPESLLGMLIAVALLAQTAGFAATTLWKGWFYRRRWFYLSCLLQGGAMLAFCFVSRPVWFAVGFAGIGASLAFTYAASLLYSLGAAESAGHAGGRHEAMIGSARIVAPLLGAGAAAATHNSRAPFAVYLAAVVVIAIIYLALFTRLSATDRAAIRARAPASSA